ncbi:double-CXXCG motif protein [Corallococcus sp. BB11-1]|uniref:SitI6 family double-CXXCG motif immunity protein n=1 Tax=Corallococcus sp. BB11-1 TaxID=2996783 RepID=UPI00226D52D1|nr:double-CXXCG motif protein [Corallococcus sp. BB11-1]MCY1030543.1 double-CXXCG motif protein [Corallococcus sp. BB11-1]
MRYFELEEPEDLESGQWSGSYRAEHRWCLPSIRCPRCGARGGLQAYPSVELSGLPENDSLTDIRPQSAEEYARRAALVRPFAAAGIVLEPACRLGPLVGTARGHFGPVTALPSWQVLVREDARDLLLGEGLQGIIPIRAELRTRRTKEQALYELEARPLAKLHPDCIDRAPTCPDCGDNGFSLPPKRWLLRESIPQGVDLFGVEETTRIVVSERFVDTVNRLGPSDVVYREITAE